MEWSDPESPNGSDIPPLVPSHSDAGGFDGDSPGNRGCCRQRDALGRHSRPRNRSFTNDSGEVGCFRKALTIMCYRYEDHSKAVMILGLLGWSRSRSPCGGCSPKGSWQPACERAVEVITHVGTLDPPAQGLGIDRSRFPGPSP